MNENTSAELDQMLKRAAAKLPTLPAVATRVLELGEDPYAGSCELASTIAPDPALSARLLKAANSPLYAQRRAVDNLRQAISLLGFNTAITLALSFSLQPSDNGGCVDKRAYWHRSLTAAISARALAELSNAGDSGRFFLAALLQDIGMLVLEQTDPEEYARLLDAATSHGELARLEIDAFGFDHAHLGARLLEQWNLPHPICQAVETSHHFCLGKEESPQSLLEGCVALSAPLADYWLGRRSGEEEALLEFAHWAHQNLHIDARGFDAVMNRIAALLPEYARLFEVDLPDAQEAARLLAEARDLLMLRNLKALQEAREFKARNEFLEANNRELQRQSKTDPLTGLYNRRHLMEEAQSEFQAAQKEGWPLTVAFLDIDYFKRVNDTYGHEAGDVILRELALLLNQQLRYSDVMARYGGEEFVVLLLGTREVEAYGLMERLRKAVEASVFSYGDQEIKVTISSGLASMLDGAEDHFDTVEALLRAADRALYVAKREGRNRTVIYGKSN